LVGPLQIIDDQDGRPPSALLGDKGQQLLGQYRQPIRAVVRGDLAPQEPDDRVPPRICGRLTHMQAIEQRVERQRLPQFVAGTPEHLTAENGRPG
jgi:hypothetical protein